MNFSTISAWENYVGQRFAELKSAFPNTISADDPRVIAIKSVRTSWHGLKVLDIGCGKGRYEEHFEAWGANYIGIDLSAEFLNTGRRNHSKVIGSGLHLPFADNSFDTVLLIETIQHSPAAEIAMENAIRCVRQGGSIIVIERNPFALSSDWPILPAVFVKWLDQYRGRWMYPHRCGVRERWIMPWQLKHQLKGTFAKTDVTFYGSLEQYETAFQKMLPVFRPFYCIYATKMVD